MNKKNLLIIAVSVLVLALIGLTYLLFSEKQTNRELVQEFQLDKEDAGRLRVLLCLHPELSTTGDTVQEEGGRNMARWFGEKP